MQEVSWKRLARRCASVLLTGAALLGLLYITLRAMPVRSLAVEYDTLAMRERRA